LALNVLLATVSDDVELALLLQLAASASRLMSPSTAAKLVQLCASESNMTIAPPQQQSVAITKPSAEGNDSRDSARKSTRITFLRIL
jgi:hypothetical protein